MERRRNEHTFDVNGKNMIRQDKLDIVENIQNEYCLKRSQFNPHHPSPNLFCNRLEIRMKAYYNTFHNSMKR